MILLNGAVELTDGPRERARRVAGEIVTKQLHHRLRAAGTGYQEQDHGRQKGSMYLGTRQGLWERNEGHDRFLWFGVRAAQRITASTSGSNSILVRGS